jgi:hypothetical protein
MGLDRGMGSKVDSTRSCAVYCRVPQSYKDPAGDPKTGDMGKTPHIPTMEGLGPVPDVWTKRGQRRCTCGAFMMFWKGQKLCTRCENRRRPKPLREAVADLLALIRRELKK